MFDINFTLVIFLISFLIFMAALNELFLKPVSEAMERRAKAIADDHESAKRRREDAKVQLDNYERQLAEIRGEAQNIINGAISESQATRTQAINKLKETGRSKLDATRTKLHEERRELVDKLVSEEENLVQLIVGKLLGEKARASVNSTEVKRALEEAL